MSAIVDKLATALHLDGVGKTVLVTGATGYLGTEVALCFLKHNWKVHLVARSQAKADEWMSTHSAATTKNTKFFIVENIVSPGAFDHAIKGVNAVAHVASPFRYDITDVERDMLQPAIQGTLSLLKSAAMEVSVKKVVLTSSFAAMLDMHKFWRPTHVYSESDWNPATYEEAKSSPNHSFVYCASKALAEKAAWDYMKDEKPGFSLCSLAPALIIGPPHQNIHSLEALNTSLSDIRAMMSSETGTIPKTEFPVGIDVRDVGLAHVKAAAHHVANGQRYLLIAWHFDNEMVANILHKKFPNLKTLVPAHEHHVHNKPFEVDCSKAVKELGMKWTPFETSVVDTANALMVLEDQLKRTKASAPSQPSQSTAAASQTGGASTEGAGQSAVSSGSEPAPQMHVVT